MHQVIAQNSKMKMNKIKKNPKNDTTAQIPLSNQFSPTCTMKCTVVSHWVPNQHVTQSRSTNFNASPQTPVNTAATACAVPQRNGICHLKLGRSACGTARESGVLVITRDHGVHSRLPLSLLLSFLISRFNFVG